MNFLCQSLPCLIRRCSRGSHRYRHRHRQTRTIYDALSTLHCPSDRGLDHAVERERHLKPVLNLKNLILSEPSKSIPLSLITESKETLGIPFRPIEFIRKYPSIFQEFHAGSFNIHPHIKLTPEVISINSEENLLYQTVYYKQEIARRLLKLLMIGRINKIPILLLERLKWELGLPLDYEKDMIPEFPHYFRVTDERSLGESDKILELVCWTEEFAVSEMDKKGIKDGNTQFFLQYSKDFEMDKKYQKWVDEWQKLPYISPYENAMHLSAKTDESDKWAVSVLHELLNIFAGKKAGRDSLLYLGEYLGLRSRFKLAFLQHPGIFYVSSKNGTHTVVLREGYKRGALIERQPLVDVRFKYVQLMNVVADNEKSRSLEKKNDMGKEDSEGKGLEVNGEDNAEVSKSSDEDEDYDDGFLRENSLNGGRFNRKGKIVEERDSRRNVSGGFNGRRTEKKGTYHTRFEGEDLSRRGGREGGDIEVKNTKRNATRLSSGRRDDGDDNCRGFGGENGCRRGKSSRHDEHFDKWNNGRIATRARGIINEDVNSSGFEDENAGKRGRFRRKHEDFEEKNSRRNVTMRADGRNVTRAGGRMSEDGNYREFEGENAGKRGRFRKNGEDFEEKNSRRNVTMRADGRNVTRASGRMSEDGNYTGFLGKIAGKRGVCRWKKGDFDRKNCTMKADGRYVTRASGRMSEDGNFKAFEGENESKRGRFRRKGGDFEGMNCRRNVSRRANGRNNEGEFV